VALPLLHGTTPKQDSTGMRIKTIRILLMTTTLDIDEELSEDEREELEYATLAAVELANRAYAKSFYDWCVNRYI